MRIMKHAAAVIIDERLRERAFGENNVMAVKLDVKILDALGVFDLNDRDGR